MPLCIRKHCLIITKINNKIINDVNLEKSHFLSTALLKQQPQRHSFKNRYTNKDELACNIEPNTEGSAETIAGGDVGYGCVRVVGGGGVGGGGWGRKNASFETSPIFLIDHKIKTCNEIKVQCQADANVK